jgi:hypothetical protein
MIHVASKANIPAVVARFPHLGEKSEFTDWHDVGERMRPIYLQGAVERQLAAVGHSNLSGTKVYRSNCVDNHFGHAYCMGTDYPLERFMMVHRAMALHNPMSRRHHITNALRLRASLMWGGLDPKMRKRDKA